MFRLLELADTAAHALWPLCPDRVLRWICDRYERALTAEG